MLIVQEFVSADGFAADAEGRFDFAGVVDDWSAIDHLQRNLIAHTGALLLGRRTYEDFRGVWPTADHPLAPAINAMTKVVVSASLDSADWKEAGPAPRVESGPLPRVVEQLTSEAAPRDVLVWGSLALTHQLLSADLVDQLRLITCPVLLGSGTTVSPPALGQKRLALSSATTFANGAVELVYDRPV